MNDKKQACNQRNDFILKKDINEPIDPQSRKNMKQDICQVITPHIQFP